MTSAICFTAARTTVPQVKTYTFDQIVADLNAIAPYDWAGFLNQRLDSISPDAPLGGIENGGWNVTYSTEPVHLFGRRANAGEAYSIGLQINAEGEVTDSIVGSPAYKAGISSNMKIIGVDGRLYTRDRLEDAIAAAKESLDADHAAVCRGRRHSHSHGRVPRRGAVSASDAR